MNRPVQRVEMVQYQVFRFRRVRPATVHDAITCRLGWRRVLIVRAPGVRVDRHVRVEPVVIDGRYRVLE